MLNERVAAILKIWTKKNNYFIYHRPLVYHSFNFRSVCVKSNFLFPHLIYDANDIIQHLLRDTKMNIFLQPTTCIMTSDYTHSNSDKKNYCFVSVCLLILITMLSGFTFQPPTENCQENLKPIDKRCYSSKYGHFLKSNRKHRSSKTWYLENDDEKLYIFSNDGDLGAYGL